MMCANAGFEILAFPCNQFGGQEPGSNPEIKEFACTRYKVEFPIFDKASQFDCFSLHHENGIAVSMANA